MGWASAGDIFDPVAQALIDLDADATTKRQVLGTLIGKLQDGDWDTEVESLERFRDDAVIVQVFYEHGVGNAMGDYPEGYIGYDDRRGLWTLTCAGGREACGEELGYGDGSSMAEHDRLVRLWAAHEKDRHGGDGVVDTDMLIDREAS